MLKIQKYSDGNSMNSKLQSDVSTFLFNSLEQYGDAMEDITKAIEYAMGRNGRTSGIVLVATIDAIIVGAVVINETGMGGYIPENILVYIATDPQHRGKGIGRQLMEEAINACKGDIALHVEPDNPAKRLYESLGFTNKYLEMRYKKTI